jgi:arylsulfatase A
VLEQPADLFTIAEKYADEATSFIAENAAASTPFMLYFPFNHIHGPNSCGARWCGQVRKLKLND